MRRELFPVLTIRSTRRWVLLVVCLLLLTGCDMMDDLGDVLYPTETIAGPAERTPLPSAPASEPTAATTYGPTFTWPAPTLTPVPLATRPPTPMPIPDKGLHLVFARGTGIYRGNYMGQEPIEVASVPQLESWAFHRGVLAIARGRTLDVIDLVKGTLNSFDLELGGSVEFSQVMLGSSAQTVLFVAVVEDETAETFGRSVALRTISRQDGAEQGRALIQDTTGVNLLYYDDLANNATLIPRGGDPEFDRAERYDLATGKVIESAPIQGEGEAVASSDGRYLLTERTGSTKGTHELTVYDLSAQATTRPKVWVHPANTHSVAHVWSPNNRYVAYLLRKGTIHEVSTEGLGLWVLDTMTMQVTKVLEEKSLSSYLVSWTPDGNHVVGYHRAESGGSHYYAVRPDAGDRQILPLDPEAQLLGWMPFTGQPAPEKIVVDPWRVRFSEAVASSTSKEAVPGTHNVEAVAGVVAQLVASQIQTDEGELTRQVAHYLQQAGWEAKDGQLEIKRLSEGIFVAQLPPFSMYVLESGLARPIASGHRILDARLAGEDLGIVFGILHADLVQPAFKLLRRQDDGEWRTVWTPQGQRDWIVTDGEIRFDGEGLQKLFVRGSSFGLSLAENEVFSECRKCPHRWLAATWIRDGDLYTRETRLPEDAPLIERLWEMTELRPYAVLYESLRRMRQSLPFEEIATNEAAGQARALGLLEKDLLLLSEQETPQGARFHDLTGKDRFFATAQDARLIRIERQSE